MGEAELDTIAGELVIRSTCCIYGDAADAALAATIARDIREYWNAPAATVLIRKRSFAVRFEITGRYDPRLAPETVWYNDDPQLNFFRIEEYAFGNISFVDGIGCNTGYFKLDNLRQTATTAPHEYGHTIGLEHPDTLDIRGGRTASIMYPRGTLCDAHLQYDPTAAASAYGGFLDPRHRQVTVEDIRDLRLHKLDFNASGKAIVGAFSSVYHDKHAAP